MRIKELPIYGQIFLDLDDQMISSVHMLILSDDVMTS